ncbi:MAG: indole-3-glycerol phosphate synthase TrpC [Armatimonadota bacterium]
MILDQILDAKRVEVELRKQKVPLRELKSRMGDAPPPLDFARRLARNELGLPAVIAEVKRASPSKGVIREDMDPVAIAASYEEAGAAAVSVLTDEQFFQGSLVYLRQIKQAVSLPVLRKDFIIDEYQVYESRASGADAILLIAAALDRDTLVELMNRATEIGLQYLVEVHDEAEMRTAIEVCAPIIGINNRNLRTFEVSLDTTARLVPMIPRAKKVSESGIFTRSDMIRLGELGVDAVLIGEALMREPNVGEKLRELIS